MKKDKNYVCYFEDGKFIEKNSDEYKNFNDKHLFRYSLTCELSKIGKIITVILMNPSYADECSLDATLDNVRKFLAEIGGYSKFQVLNIFPIRTPNSKGLIDKMEKYPEIQAKNIEYIKKVLKGGNDVLVAWGSKYHKHATWIFEHLKGKNVYAYGINKDFSPRHFAPQEYNRCKAKKMQKYEFKK